jgi:hypothetical protein
MLLFKKFTNKHKNVKKYFNIDRINDLLENSMTLMYLPKTLIDFSDVSNEYLCIAIGMRYPDLFPKYVMSRDIKYNKVEASKSLFLAPI